MIARLRSSLRRRRDDPSLIDLALLERWTDDPVTAEPATLATPSLLKTRIAREVVVAVLVDSERPMTRQEALALATADEKVQSAGVSRNTLSSELTAALAESPPRVVRLGRGIYCAAELAAPPSRALQWPVAEKCM